MEGMKGYGKAAEGCEKFVSKENLRESRTCRLCGTGSRLEVLKTDVSFVPLFEDQDSEENLSLLINRYLPIEVVELDPSYPRVICNSCFTSLWQTVAFFDKIIAGQKLMSKIVNSYGAKVGEKMAVVKEVDVKLKFSEDNPVTRAPKKRGRPRRVPGVKEENTGKLDNEAIVFEPRSKRISRPPARFIDQMLQTTAAKNYSEDVKTDMNENVGSPIEVINTMTVTDDQSVIFNGLSEMDVGATAASTSVQHPVPESSKFGKLRSCEDENSSIYSDGAGMVTLNTSEENNDDKDFKVRLKDISTKSSHIRDKSKSKKRAVKRPHRKYFCEKCPKSFNHSSSLLYHRIAAHETQKKFTCETCGRAFTHKQLLTNHSYVHLEEKCFSCDLCNAKFKSRASMYTHKKSIHSKVREFTCEFCGYQFNLKSSLKAHMRLHTGEKPYKCEFCQKTFAQRSNLREHRRTHTGERPYVCTVCSKSFTTGSQLRSHKFCHSDSKTHLCQICGKGFTHAENFKYHMRRHSHEKPLECQTCKKQFSEPWAFRKHLRLHSGVKPYECGHCKKAFADPSNFAKHKKLHPPVDNENQQTIETRAMPVKSVVQKDVLDVSNNPETSTSASARHETAVENQSSIVHIVTSTEGNYESSAHSSGQEHVQQVIYVYGDNGPLFTFAMADGSQTQEIKSVNDLSDLNCMETLDERIVASTPQEFESHYYTLETIDGDTVAVPITIQRPSMTESSPSDPVELTSSSSSLKSLQ